MTPDDALQEIIEAVAALSGAPHTIGWKTTQQWPNGTIEALIRSGLLCTTRQAETIECLKCDNNCCLDVIAVPHKERPTRYFMVCDDTEMQGQIGRSEIPVEQLQQWRTTPLQIAQTVAKLWGLDNKIEQQPNKQHIRIGMVKGANGRKWLVLNLSPLALEINGHAVSIADSIYFDKGQLLIDREYIQSCSDNAPRDHKKAYTSSTTKQEAGSLKTEVRNKDIQQAYSDIRKKNPRSSFHTDQWVAKQISKLDIAQGCSVSRITRIMKG